MAWGVKLGCGNLHTEHAMSYSSDHNVAHVRPDPFASLVEAPTRRRFWLAELFTAPFHDQDERAAYQLSLRAAKETGSDRGLFTRAGRRSAGH